MLFIKDPSQIQDLRHYKSREQARHLYRCACLPARALVYSGAVALVHYQPLAVVVLAGLCLLWLLWHLSFSEDDVWWSRWYLVAETSVIGALALAAWLDQQHALATIGTAVILAMHWVASADKACHWNPYYA